MTFEQFAYWLQGFAELNGREPSAAEWKMIKEHLATCFNKVTPPIDIWLDSIKNKDIWKMPPATCTDTGFNPLAEKSTVC